VMKKIVRYLTVLSVLFLPNLGWANNAGEGMPRWRGAYTCIQGMTGLTLTIDLQSQTARFEFYPLRSTDPVARGSFVLGGRLPLKGSDMVLDPVRWLSQPPGYVMVGLRGTTNDNGLTYQGVVTGGAGCSNFTLRRDPR
jgi:hypothetical protein